MNVNYEIFKPKGPGQGPSTPPPPPPPSNKKITNIYIDAGKGSSQTESILTSIVEINFRLQSVENQLANISTERPYPYDLRNGKCNCYIQFDIDAFQSHVRV
jgi:hypothetical protein